MAESIVPRQPDFATSYKPGHVQKIYIRNFVQFKGDHILHLRNDDSGTSTFVVFVGDNGTGKSAVMRLISTINIFRKTSESSDRKLDKNLVENVKFAEMVFTSNKQVQSHRIDKTERDKEGIFIIQLTSEDPSHPIYCVLYSTPQDEAWCWNYKRSDNTNTYSQAFVLDIKSRKVYVLKPTQNAEDPTSDFIVEYKLSEDEADEPDVFTLVETCIKKDSETFKIDELPKDIMSLLPSCLCTPYVHHDLKPELPEERNLRKYGEFLQFILAEPSSLQTRCLLIARPTESVYPSQEPKYQEMFSKICKTFKIQFIITTYNDGILKWDLASTVIRFWKSRDENRHTVRIPHKFIQHCTRNEWSPLKILSYNIIMLVEGKSDANVLEAVLSQSVYEGEKWLSSICPLDPETHATFRFLANNTLVFDVIGEGNFQKVLGFFLQYAKLCFFNFIVCDGDTLLGGTVQDVEKDPSTCEHKSNLLGRHQKSVLHECIKHLQGDPLVQKVYDALHDHFIQTIGSPSSSITEKMKEILGRHCNSPGNCRKFSEDCLFTFAWLTEGTSDLESVTKLSSGASSHPRSRLASSKMLASEVAEHLVKSKNKEVTRFLLFIINKVAHGYMKLEQALLL